MEKRYKQSPLKSLKMSEIKVTKCRDCPKFMASENNPVQDGLCVATKDWIVIYSDYSIHSKCPLKGQTITFKIGDDE